MRSYNLNIISEEVTPLHGKFMDSSGLKDCISNVTANELKLKYTQKLTFIVVGSIAIFGFVLNFFFLYNI